jgi:hypothetical protein
MAVAQALRGGHPLPEPQMQTSSPSRLTLAAAALATALLAGCIVVPAGRPYGGGAAVIVEPPAPQVEVMGVAPGPGYFWINGYWNWFGGRHVWIGGHWESHRPGYRWEPHRWYRDGPGWRAEPGHWERH